MKSATLAAALFLLSTFALHAQIPLTLRSVTQASRMSDVEFSPDGRSIAFVSNHSGASKIWVIGAQGGTPKNLVAGAEAETSPQWSPDGKRIAFLSARGGQVDIWTVGASGGEPVRVTNEKSGKHGIRWSPDSKSLAFISDKAKDQDIYVVSATAGAQPRQLTHQTNEWDEGRWAPAWSPDGKRIAFVSGKDNYYADDLWTVDADGSHLEKLTSEITLMGDPLWSPDGRSIAFNAVKNCEYWFEDMSELYVFDFANRKLREVKMEPFVSDFEMNAHVYWSADSRTLYFRYLTRGNTNIWAVGADARFSATQVTNAKGAIPSMDISGAGKSIAFVNVTSTSPGDLFTLPLAGGTPDQLTHWATAYEGVRAPTPVAYRARDGLYIHGYLYLPPGAGGDAKYPSLVSVHGGGTNAYGNGFHGLEQYLASKGFAVLAIEYRGSSGYGRPFQMLSVGDWTVGQGWDAVAASDFLHAQPFSNGKVGIYGGSYGGIMTMAAVARDSSKFQAAAPFYGIYDWVAAYGDADRLGKIFLVTGFQGYKPEDNPDLYYRNSTINFLQNITTPLLIEHGEQDRRAPYSQAMRVIDVLTNEHKTFEFFHYPNEQHGIRHPDNYVDAYTRMEAFFDKYLR